MKTVIPREADWATAPNLLDGAMQLELTARDCNLAYWLNAVPAGTLRGRPDGYDPAITIGHHMRSGPLYEAITQEYAFRALAEDKAARGLAYLVPTAPDVDVMEFYVTQMLDEARHAMVFRNHLVTLGTPAADLARAMERFAGPDCVAILEPLEAFALRVMRDERDFLGGVVMMTIIIEGALAPAAELSERKWRPFDLAAAEIDRGAAIDEIRHLTVGAAVGRTRLLEHPEEKDRMVDLISDGMRLWQRLPVRQMQHRRELLFQKGLESYPDVVGDYEIWPGRRLLDTSPQERQAMADRWTQELRERRLRYMGLAEALVVTDDALASAEEAA